MVARLKEQRDANLQVLTLTEETKLKEANSGANQSSETNSMIKQVLEQIERKVQEDTQQRQSEQAEIKQLLEHRMLSLLDKLRNDERQSLERERRLMEQVQEGLQTMNEIIRGTKEHS